jgi:rhodanese-related sulfurtransferase
MQSISVSNLADMQKKCDVVLIDVRTPVEFREAHAKSARNFPLDSLDPAAVVATCGCGDHPMYIICNSGGRSTKATQKFLDAGIENVVNVEGGTKAWVAANLPVNRGKKAIALERQVRIAAGSLTFLGAVLGFFISPYFIALSAFIGAGLVFSGVTDTCGMGMLISKMPWNQCQTESSTCAVPR